MGNSLPSSGPMASSVADMNRALAHELHVHQIELEMQNEELRRAQFDLASARDRLVDLYDFAPVGYFTLDELGMVIEANLTGVALLGEERQRVLGRRFAKFVACADGDRWHLHLLQSLRSKGPHRIELLLQSRSGERFHGQLDCLPVPPDAGRGASLRVTMIDISERKRAEMDRRIASTVTEGREAERRRLSRELHEDLGQRLSAVKMDLAGLRPGQARPAQVSRIDAMMGVLDDAMATVRRISSDLRPSMLDDLGLNAAIDWLARDTARRLGLVITLQLEDVDPLLDERTSVALYRLVQDLLTYMACERRVAEVRIGLSRQVGELVLTVGDTGAGGPVPIDADPGSEPIRLLSDQVHHLGARLVLHEQADGAQRVTARVPLPGLEGGWPASRPARVSGG
ncbi:PAS domain S-box-containing protein [Sphaerotilus hippei]|uniref:PAS domain S-box-containing protein n=2 Tax=Sphaerotilus hippei TaxID=744406 RepID=A0A318GZV7_9BURK|nr:PAS domain S-box-containing protein [Sphaerotilus hippei]